MKKFQCKQKIGYYYKNSTIKAISYLENETKKILAELSLDCHWD